MSSVELKEVAASFCKLMQPSCDFIVSCLSESTEEAFRPTLEVQDLHLKWDSSLYFCLFMFYLIFLHMYGIYIWVLDTSNFQLDFSNSFLISFCHSLTNRFFQTFLVVTTYLAVTVHSTFEYDFS